MNLAALNQSKTTSKSATINAVLMVRKITKFVLPVLVLSIAIGSFQYLKANKPERKPPQLREKVWQVETVTANIQSLAPLVRLYGQVESRNLVKAGAIGSAKVLPWSSLTAAISKQPSHAQKPSLPTSAASCRNLISDSRPISWPCKVNNAY